MEIVLKHGRCFIACKGLLYISLGPHDCLCFTEFGRSIDRRLRMTGNNSFHAKSVGEWRFYCMNIVQVSATNCKYADDKFFSQKILYANRKWVISVLVPPVPPQQCTVELKRCGTVPDRLTALTLKQEIWNTRGKRKSVSGRCCNISAGPTHKLSEMSQSLMWVLVASSGVVLWRKVCDSLNVCGWTRCFC